MNQSGTPRRSTSGSSSERSSPRRQMSRAEDPQTSRKATSREATAYHEAGHAVAAWKLGYRPIIVSIAAANESVGEVRHESPFPGDSLEFDGSDLARLRVERAIIIRLAGRLTRSDIAPRHGGAGKAAPTTQSRLILHFGSAVREKLQAHS